MWCFSNLLYIIEMKSLLKVIDQFSNYGIYSVVNNLRTYKKIIDVEKLLGSGSDKFKLKMVLIMFASVKYIFYRQSSGTILKQTNNWKRFLVTNLLLIVIITTWFCVSKFCINIFSTVYSFCSIVLIIV